MNEPLEIGKIWTLSTGHLTPGTRKKLEKPRTAGPKVPVIPYYEED